MKKYLAIVLLLVFIGLNAFSATWHKGVYRVNTNISAGSESIETVCDKASDHGLEFIVFSDQFIVHAEYGFPPFRNLVRKSLDRRSVVTYGISEYLREIDDADMKRNNLVLIPGVDIAPHYYWTGSFMSGKLCTRQFSEQLTVFGTDEPDFYRKLPVIHNEWTEFKIGSFLLSILPLLTSVAGIWILAMAFVPYYSDDQGNRYYKRRKLKFALSGVLIVTGIIWTLDNKPLTDKKGFDQYKNYGTMPYQKVIDYVREKGGDKAGITWSAPEATMKMSIGRIMLHTLPYLSDIENTDGHNGFAGIYGDAFHAHEAGKTWDKLLLEYCSGKRKVRPIVVGEADYHGLGRLNMIQTVVNVETLGRKEIVDAILNGNSYAALVNSNMEIQIQHASLNCEGNSAGMGGDLILPEGKSSILNISGKVSYSENEQKVEGTIIAVANGKQILKRQINLKNFAFLEKISADSFADSENGYLRFYVQAPSAGMIISNPIFVKKVKSK